MLTKPNYPFPNYIYGLKLISKIEVWVSYVTLFFDIDMIYFNVSQFKQNTRTNGYLEIIYCLVSAE